MNEMNFLNANRTVGKIYPIVLIIVLYFTNSMFAQVHILQIAKTDGSITYTVVSDITNLTFLECSPTVEDADGNIYNTVIIGNQCWMKENLNVGTMIPSNTLGDNQVDNSIIEKYCLYNEIANCVTYGGLYQWNEAIQYNPSDSAVVGTTQGICPTGWHIPTLAEFTILKTNVSSSGNSLKAIGEGADLGAGTNTSGFSALLAGQRDYYYGGFVSSSAGQANFWSSSEYSSIWSHSLFLAAGDDVIDLTQKDKNNGFSIRCLKD